MIGKDELAEAARYADAQAEEVGLEKWCELHGVDLEGVAHVASQRAIRAAYTLDGNDPTKLPRSGPLFAVELSNASRRLVPLLASIAMDGMSIGVTAKETERRAEGDTPELPWSVGFTLTSTPIARFDTHDHAAAFIGLLPDHEKGIYYLDGPEGEG